jgi:cell surface protein SprA
MSLMEEVGTRLNVNANYDTQSTFAFQNLIKLEYTPSEDDIIQKLSGKCSMPLNSSLIRGRKVCLGKTNLVGTTVEVFSGKITNKSVSVRKWRYNQDFDMFALDYDSDRHFSVSVF